MNNSPHRVLVVDDSKAMCQFLSDALERDPSLTVVGTALDPFEARDLIKQQRPDVITLDVEMPRMDGITFLKNLMRLRPMPVVMISSLTAAGAAVTLDALKIGAVDFMVKRHPATKEQLGDYIQDICDCVRNAATTVVENTERSGRSAVNHPDYAAWQERMRSSSMVTNKIRRILAIGASTGGPEAVRQVLSNVYASDAAVFICQHMPARFLGPFAERLHQYSKFDIRKAKDGEVVRPGFGYVAPGDHHLSLKRQGGDLICQVKPGEKVNGHMPAVDVTFDSLAAFGDSVLGVLLTGMGCDGAQGLKRMHDAGALTFAQDEHTSAVWGMPGAGVRLGGADGVLPLQDIGPTLNELLG